MNKNQKILLMVILMFICFGLAILLKACDRTEAAEYSVAGDQIAPAHYINFHKQLDVEKILEERAESESASIEESIAESIAIEESIIQASIEAESIEESIAESIAESEAAEATRYSGYYPLSYDDMVAMAQTVYGEAHGCGEHEEWLVCVVILNRLSMNYGGAASVYEVVTAPHQFVGYSPNHPVLDSTWATCEKAVQDWLKHNDGYDVEWYNYTSFRGAGDHNVFR